MPVEIRELQIVTVVSENADHQQPAVGAESINMDRIIAECVEQVMEILKQKNER